MVTEHVLSKIFWIIKWTLRWFVFLVTLSAVDHEVLQPPTRVTEFLMSKCLLVNSNGGIDTSYIWPTRNWASFSCFQDTQYWSGHSREHHAWVSNESEPGWPFPNPCLEVYCLRSIYGSLKVYFIALYQYK